MKRSELKQLIREVIEEISADTAQKVSDRAAALGRTNQSPRLSAVADKKKEEELLAALGGNNTITIKVGEKGTPQKVKITDIYPGSGRNDYPYVLTTGGRTGYILVFRDDKEPPYRGRIRAIPGDGLNSGYFGDIVYVTRDSRETLLNAFEHLANISDRWRGPKVKLTNIDLIDD